MNLYKIQQHFYPHRILDIGANAGQFHTIAKQTYPDSFVFSIEAAAECEPYLKQLTENYYIGLLAKDNSNYNYYTRKNDPTCTGNSIYRELTQFYSDDQLVVLKKAGIKLDDLFEEDSEFDLIKIDTQGSELDIISGGLNLCKKAKGILLEVSLTQYNENSPLYDEVISYMRSIGFVKVDMLDESRNHGSHQQDILFVKNKLTIHDTCWGKYAAHYYAQDLQKVLSDSIDVDLKTVNLDSYKGMFGLNNLEGSAVVVENTDSKFVIFDWGDCFEVNEGIMKLHNHPDCVGYYNSQPSKQINEGKTYIPHCEFKYEVFNKRYINHYRNSFDNLKSKIYFNGEITNIRISNNEFLKNETYKKYPEFEVLQKTDFDTYIRDLFEYKVVYSPAGGGDFTHRDFETFALGIPVIRQKYKSPTTTLQEGIHYIDINTVSDFKALLKDKELLCSIGENGRLWYEQNCLYPGNVSELKKIIIDKLV